MFSEKIHITKKKDISGKVYYTAHLGDQIGGGATRNEAKDELIKNVVCFMDYLEKENFRLSREILQLKQQLAEKDEQLDALNKFLSDKATEIESLRTKAYVNMLHQEMLELKVATQDQDKISFCIEQLEKVLPSIKATIELAENRHQMKDQVDIIIDNQIKTLGGEK